MNIAVVSRDGRHVCFRQTRYAVDGHRGRGRAHLWLARNAEHARAPVAADLGDQELFMLTRSEIAQAGREGQFKVLGWTSVMACALLQDARHHGPA